MEDENQAASVGRRIRAFLLDYALIFIYLVVLALVGSWLTYGPSGPTWSRLLAHPVRADLLAFLTSVLPVTLYFSVFEASASSGTPGKRAVGLEVRDLADERISLPRSLLRSGLKFLPWQMAHTAMFQIPGFPFTPEDPPAGSVALLLVAWLLVIGYLVGLTDLGGRRTLYDRISGTTVMARRELAPLLESGEVK